jgi:hypothetical protein
MDWAEAHVQAVVNAPWSRRFAALFAFVFAIDQLLAPCLAQAAELEPATTVQTRAAKNPAASTPSAFLPAPAQAYTAPHFSSPPTDQEILVSGVLPQPLAPVGGASDGDENRALGQALIQYLDSLQRGAMRSAR